MRRVTECELDIRPGAFHKLLERVALVALDGIIQFLIYYLESLS